MFFGRIQGYQKVLSKLIDLYNNSKLSISREHFLMILFTSRSGSIFCCLQWKQSKNCNLYDWYGNFRIEMISADTQHLNEINWEPLQHCCYPKPLLGVLEDLFLERLKFELRLWKDFLFLFWAELSMLYAMSYVLSFVPFFLPF